MAAERADTGAAVAIDEPLRLAESLCARLCHDIAGPLGALMGSLELAREQAGLTEEVLSMASAAGRELTARLELLRAAWVGDGAPLDLARLAELAQGLPARRIALDLSALPSETVFAAPAGRVVLNLVLLGAEALPAGGTIWLELADEDLLISVGGPRAAWPAALAAALAGEAVIDGPRGLQAPLTVLLARSACLALALLMPAGPAAPDSAPPLLLGLPARC